MKSPLLSARIRIPASLSALSLVAGAFAFLLPSRTFFRHVARGSHVLAAGPASTRTYQEGSRLYLDNGTVKVGLETAWGGAITEVVWHGMNFVNDYDTGRDIQVALYDGDPYPPCDGCKKEQGWDPVQGGDLHKHGSPLLAHTLEKDSIYIKTQPHHWYPDNKGGGPDKPVPSDVFIEQWVSFLPDNPQGIKIHYKTTHFGKDQHANAKQEFPAVYVNWEFGRFVYYGGEAPWTNGPVSFLTMPNLPKSSPQIYTPEHWGGFVNDDGIGLAAFVPGQYPYVAGFRTGPDARRKFATNYFSPHVSFSFGPNNVLEADAYLFAGDYRQARQAIYSLRRSLPERDSSPPYGIVDEPTRNTRCTGPLKIGGWAIDDTQLSEVDILLDEHFVGRATYGVPRPDVSKFLSHAPTSSGFRYTLDTTQYPNGKHLLGVDAKDSAGKVAVLSRIPIVIDNPSDATAPK